MTATIRVRARAPVTAVKTSLWTCILAVAVMDLSCNGVVLDAVVSG
jgi:hypothetical protein